MWRPAPWYSSYGPTLGTDPLPQVCRTINAEMRAAAEVQRLAGVSAVWRVDFLHLGEKGLGLGSGEVVGAAPTAAPHIVRGGLEGAAKAPAAACLPVRLSGGGGKSRGPQLLEALLTTDALALGSFSHAVEAPSPDGGAPKPRPPPARRSSFSRSLSSSKVSASPFSAPPFPSTWPEGCFSVLKLASQGAHRFESAALFAVLLQRRSRAHGCPGLPRRGGRGATRPGGTLDRLQEEVPRRSRYRRNALLLAVLWPCAPRRWALSLLAPPHGQRVQVRLWCTIARGGWCGSQR